jgi:YD repeat-containing protein
LNTTFSYDGTGKLTSRTMPSGVVTTSQYDSLNRLTHLTHAKGANTLADLQYQFSAVDNITLMTDGAGAHNYTYDSHRLTAERIRTRQVNATRLTLLATAQLRIKGQAIAIKHSIVR